MSAQPKLVHEISVFETVQTISPLELFSEGNLDHLITRIETELNSQQPDTGTKSGRDSIASFAHKIAKAKVRIDKAGKELGAEYREKLNALNGERSTVKHHLETLQTVARKPLDEWEAVEAEREAAELFAARMTLDHEDAMIEHDLFLRLEAVETKERELAEAEEKRLAAERAETERKAADQAETDRIKREARIREAAIKQAEEDRIEAENLAAIRAEEDAQRLKDQEAQAERDQAIAVAEARRHEQQRARDFELERQAEEDRRRDESSRLAADRAHRQGIHARAASDLETANVRDANMVVDLIATGNISHINITY